MKRGLGESDVTLSTQSQNCSTNQIHSRLVRLVVLLARIKGKTGVLTHSEELCWLYSNRYLPVSTWPGAVYAFIRDDTD